MTSAQTSRRTSRPLAAAAALLSLLALAAPCFAQDQSTYDADRKRAFELMRNATFLEALPILERLAAQNPKDAAVQEQLGSAILAKAATMTDPDARKQARIRARHLLLNAKALGDDSDLMKTLLEGLPEDGSESNFSSHKDADAAMREGEDAFAKADYDRALAAYQRALLLDPKLCEAALFTGDVYFHRKDVDTAGLWYGRAISIDPNRETAYRYWGDALFGAGKSTEARDKFIEAIIASPYERKARQGLNEWSAATKRPLQQPAQINSPNSAQTDGGKTTLTIDPSSLGAKDGREAWMMYDITRVSWKNEKFAKQYPRETAYRHSLGEEADALHLVATVAETNFKGKKIDKLDPALQKLVTLDQEGLLESYILIVKADQGIAQDYAAYRDAHRDLLRKYFLEYVVPKD